MAARWGAGEEIISACNMDFFSTNVLDEQGVILPGGLSSGCMAGLELEPDEPLGTLHSCMDPSILSIFEDTPTENKSGLDEESETTLLTALTEILDNVDDKNLSPFDMLPESDLLSGQKGREHSPLRRLCLSQSPPEKEMYCNTRHILSGKSLPSLHASVQRSDGEEEEDGEAYSVSLSPNSQPLSPEQGLLSWGDLALPLSVKQHMETEFEDGVSLSLSLGELVKHMHPYCMSVRLENGEEEMLPEEGILLEVVDQGEDGETIFAISDMGISLSKPPRPLPEEEDSCKTGPRVPADISKAVVLEASDDDDDVVVVDDDDDLTVVAGSVATLRGERDVGRRPKERAERCPSRRKKKQKNREKEKSSSAKITLETAQSDGRVLRSSSNRRATLEPTTRKLVKETTKPERNENELFIAAISTTNTSNPKVKAPRPAKMQYVQLRTQVSTLTLPSHPGVKVVPASHSISNVRPPGLVPKNVNTTPDKVSQLTLACEKPKGRPASTANPLAPQTRAALKETPFPALTPTQHPNPQEAPASEAPQVTLQLNAVTSAPQVFLEPNEVPPPFEAKPKPLSLEQYRLLRQQKKPTPIRQMEDPSTKWPSLPEAPTELPPIPCLPAPCPRDPRRPQPTLGKNVVVEEVKSAWQPKGLGAPPTPEALLVPPAYMNVSKTSYTSKVVGATVTPKAPPPQDNVPAEASQAPAPVSSVPASATVKLVPQTPSVKLSNVPSVPLPQSLHPSLKNVDLISFQNLKGIISKTTTFLKPLHRPTQIAAILPPKHTPVAAAVLEKTLTPTTVAAVSVQKHTPSAISKGAATLQKAILLPHHMSAVSAAPAPTQPCRPLMRCTPTHKALKAKSPTQEPIESFTSEVGIEAADLTSLLEQFEETQAKEDQCVPEVSGRVAAVGNSSVQLQCDRTAVERVKAHDLTSTAGLTPPATPPHQMWKPLVPITLLGKNRATEATKSSPSKAIQIDPRPLPSNKLWSKPNCLSMTTTPDPVALSLAILDHDYCLPQKEPVDVPGEPGKCWNFKQQAAITIKTMEPVNSPTNRVPQTIPAPFLQTLTPAPCVILRQDPLGPQPMNVRKEKPSSVLETPETSPTRLEEHAGPTERCPKRERSYRGNTTCSPRQSPEPRECKRGRERKRRFPRSSSPGWTGSESDSHSSSGSRSRSPPRKRYRPRRTDSNSSASSRSCSCSCTSSPSQSRSPPRRRRYSYSSSRSGSWSTSHSRSPRRRVWSRSSRRRSPSLRPGYRPVSKENSEEIKRQKEKAIEERRVVYVGRIRGTMTRKELKDRFSLYGEIEECTLHFRDHGDNYGFVTYYDTKDAFMAIENGGKLRKPDELPFDLCFGGRRQFCKTSYADLDSNREYDPLPTKGKFDALDFDTLLKQAQKGLRR